MRNLKDLDDNGLPRSKGYGFVSFKRHEDALSALRALNNNPDVFSDKKVILYHFIVNLFSVLFGQIVLRKHLFLMQMLKIVNCIEMIFRGKPPLTLSQNLTKLSVPGKMFQINLMLFQVWNKYTKENRWTLFRENRKRNLKNRFCNVVLPLLTVFRQNIFRFIWCHIWLTIKLKIEESLNLKFRLSYHLVILALRFG